MTVDPALLSAYAVRADAGVVMIVVFLSLLVTALLTACLLWARTLELTINTDRHMMIRKVAFMIFAFSSTEPWNWTLARPKPGQWRGLYRGVYHRAPVSIEGHFSKSERSGAPGARRKTKMKRPLRDAALRAAGRTNASVPT